MGLPAVTVDGKLDEEEEAFHPTLECGAGLPAQVTFPISRLDFTILDDESPAITGESAFIVYRA